MSTWVRFNENLLIPNVGTFAAGDVGAVPDGIAEELVKRGAATRLDADPMDADPTATSTEEDS